ncbi:ribbon-helix-helix domain-containing protein [Enterovirga aerilata]|uniref:Ribbon-helix-helix domain-containing protein n=1 Tax=Enterovirga aerilata TaxID=2730920 RepID=A0A849IEV8_9HYPH|nr:ribbon-helix-helix domain-containing protein [Enterovirga sp. DB1703]NNM72413.1 ribbon-helix-helix domain-containing protein [Enterovirga sp. DB1703]
MKIYEDAPVSAKVPCGLIPIIDNLAARLRIRRSDLIRKALADYLSAAGAPLPSQMRLALRGAR